MQSTALYWPVLKVVIIVYDLYMCGTMSQYFLHSNSEKVKSQRLCSMKYSRCPCFSSTKSSLLSTKISCREISTSSISEAWPFQILMVRMESFPHCLVLHVLTAKTRTKHPQQTVNTPTILSKHKGCACWTAFWQFFTLTCPLRSDGWSTVGSLCWWRGTHAWVCHVLILLKYIPNKFNPWSFL